MKAFGMLHVRMSLSSCALITPAIMMLSNAAVGLAASSPDSYSLVG
jgi:hypothetical protein